MKREGRIVYVVGLARLRMRLAALDAGRRDDVGSTPPISDPCNTSRLRMTRNKWGCVHTLFFGFGKIDAQLTTYWLMMDGTVDPVAWRKMGREGTYGRIGKRCVVCGVWKLAGPSLLIFPYDNYHSPPNFTSVSRSELWRLVRTCQVQVRYILQ